MEAVVGWPDSVSATYTLTLVSPFFSSQSFSSTRHVTPAPDLPLRSSTNKHVLLFKYHASLLPFLPCRLPPPLRPPPLFRRASAAFTIMSSPFSRLLALACLFCSVYSATIAHRHDDHDHAPVNRRLPSTWYQPDDHPAHALFKRAPTDGAVYAQVGSPSTSSQLYFTARIHALSNRDIILYSMGRCLS